MRVRIDMPRPIGETGLTPSPTREGGNPTLSGSPSPAAGVRGIGRPSHCNGVRMNGRGHLDAFVGGTRHRSPH